MLEPVLLLGKERFAEVDIRVRVKGGGQVSQIYGMRPLKKKKENEKNRIERKN
mgnify:CR=1 FL=1